MGACAVMTLLYVTLVVVLICVVVDALLAALVAHWICARVRGFVHRWLMLPSVLKGRGR